MVDLDCHKTKRGAVTRKVDSNVEVDTGQAQVEADVVMEQAEVRGGKVEVEFSQSGISRPETGGRCPMKRDWRR